jgi:hypothetical protein
MEAHMPFSVGDRVRVTQDKTYGGRTIPAGTPGTITSYIPFLDEYTVQFDGDLYIRSVIASDLEEQT